MFKLFRSLTLDESAASGSDRRARNELAPDTVLLDGSPSFSLAAHLTRVNGLPYVDWKAVEAWVSALPMELQTRAWSASTAAWLLHLGEALGPQYRLDEARRALLLSTLDSPLARIALEFMERTSTRIVRLLEGVAAAPEKGKSILIVFDDEESYYNYVAYYYPEKGEFAFSGGMFIDSGCGHFATVKSDLRLVEPTIAHEMAHASVAHLPLPLWLNEGLAVNTERALAPSGRPLYAPEEMRRKHRAFWRALEIQEFWSGRSFARTDEANMLSYDLAQIMVEQMAKDWPAFRAFVLAAHRADSGNKAARTHLGVELGEYVSLLLEKNESEGWVPDPASWGPDPEALGPALK